MAEYLTQHLLQTIGNIVCSAKIRFCPHCTTLSPLLPIHLCDTLASIASQILSNISMNTDSVKNSLWQLNLLQEHYLSKNNYTKIGQFWGLFY